MYTIVRTSYILRDFQYAISKLTWFMDRFLKKILNVHVRDHPAIFMIVAKGTEVLLALFVEAARVL